MIVLIPLVLVLVIVLWRKARKARQRQRAVVTAAPVVQALAGAPVRRSPPSRWAGSRGSM
jgi:hypothetical protein